MRGQENIKVTVRVPEHIKKDEFEKIVMSYKNYIDSYKKFGRMLSYNTYNLKKTSFSLSYKVYFLYKELLKELSDLKSSLHKFLYFCSVVEKKNIIFYFVIPDYVVLNNYEVVKREDYLENLKEYFSKKIFPNIIVNVNPVILNLNTFSIRVSYNFITKKLKVLYPETYQIELFVEPYELFSFIS